MSEDERLQLKQIMQRDKEMVRTVTFTCDLYTHIK